MRRQHLRLVTPHRASCEGRCEDGLAGRCHKYDTNMGYYMKLLIFKPQGTDSLPTPPSCPSGPQQCYHGPLLVRGFDDDDFDEHVFSRGPLISDVLSLMLEG